MYVCCQVIMPCILWTYAPGILANCWISCNESHWTFKTLKLQLHVWKGLQKYKTEANHSFGHQFKSELKRALTKTKD